MEILTQLGLPFGPWLADHAKAYPLKDWAAEDNAKAGVRRARKARFREEFNAMAKAHPNLALTPI